MDGTSRVTGDSQARFCERLGAKFPGPTRPSTDHAGACSGSQFVVSKTGKAYDVRTRGLNRKFRLEVFFANPRFADFGVCGGVGGGISLPCAG
jgi:hypothetical protein